MNIQNSKYYQTLTELDGETKFDMLKSIQLAKQKISSLKDENPELFRLANRFRSAFESIRPIPDIMRPLIEAHNAMQGYVSERLKLAKRIKVLAQNGWYLSIWFIDSVEIQDLPTVLLNDPELFELIVTKLFEEKLVNTIQRGLLDRFPKRAEAINSIIASHKREDYFAVIPLALTLADGLCKDTFFIINNGEKIPIGFFDLEKPKKAKSTQKLKKVFAVSDTSVFSLLTNQLADDDRNRHLLHEQNTSKL